MKRAKNKKNGGIWSVLKKVWQCIWNSGSSPADCPEQIKSAQDHRDEALKKCPWYEQ